MRRATAAARNLGPIGGQPAERYTPWCPFWCLIRRLALMTDSQHCTGLMPILQVLSAFQAGDTDSNSVGAPLTTPSPPPAELKNCYQQVEPCSKTLTVA